MRLDTLCSYLATNGNFEGHMDIICRRNGNDSRYYGLSGLPICSRSYSTNSALDSSNGVPQWYGSAETFDPSTG